MLSIKVIYNDETSGKLSSIIAAKGNPMFEYYNESDPKQIKKAWKYKGAAGAKELPFVSVYENDKLIKAFYAEDNSACDGEVLDWLGDYVKSNAKSGYMKVTKLEGNNNERYEPGATHEGNTSNFIEGVSLFLTSNMHWFKTSPIVSINWEDNTFKTCNSTYKFELDESRDTN